MTSLITLLIALLGYGTPSDFSHMSEDELNHEITMAEANRDSGGGVGGWDAPDVHEDEEDQTDPDPVDPTNGGN